MKQCSHPGSLSSPIHRSQPDSSPRFLREGASLKTLSCGRTTTTSDASCKLVSSTVLGSNFTYKLTGSLYKDLSQKPPNRRDAEGKVWAWSVELLWPLQVCQCTSTSICSPTWNLQFLLLLCEILLVLIFVFQIQEIFFSPKLLMTPTEIG